MSLRKTGTAEPTQVEVERAPEDLSRTAGRQWSEDDDRRLAEENAEDDAL